MKYPLFKKKFGLWLILIDSYRCFEGFSIKDCYYRYTETLSPMNRYFENGKYRGPK